MAIKGRQHEDRGAGDEPGLAVEKPAPLRSGATSKRCSAAEKRALLDEFGRVRAKLSKFCARRGKSAMGIWTQSFVALLSTGGGVRCGAADCPAGDDPRDGAPVAAPQHPPIVEVYDIGDFDGRPCFTMELVEDGSLALHPLSGAPDVCTSHGDVSNWFGDPAPATTLRRQDSSRASAADKNRHNLRDVLCLRASASSASSPHTSVPMTDAHALAQVEPSRRLHDPCSKSRIAATQGARGRCAQVRR